MKTKIKLLSIIAVALCSVMAGAFAFAGCGETSNTGNNDTDNPGPAPVDPGPSGSEDPVEDSIYLNTAENEDGTSSASTVGKTWTQLYAETVGTWDTKEVVFQFVSPLFDVYDAYNVSDSFEVTYGNVVPGVKCAILMNLYKDGTAAAFEFLKYDDESAASAVTGWWNEGTQIYTAYFGWWLGGYDGSGAMSNGYALKVSLAGPLSNDWVITNDTKTPESTPGACALEINAIKENDSTEMDAPYVYNPDGTVTFRYQYSAKRYLGLALPGGVAGWVDDSKFAEGESMTAVINDIKYDKIQKWADELLGKEGGGPQGEDGGPFLG